MTNSIHHSNLSLEALKSEVYALYGFSTAKEAKKLIRSMVSPGDQPFAKLDMRSRECWVYLYELGCEHLGPAEEEFSDLTLDSLVDELAVYSQILTDSQCGMPVWGHLDPVLTAWDCEQFYAGLSCGEYLLQAKNAIVPFSAKRFDRAAEDDS